jgi:hypothetical protein
VERALSFFGLYDVFGYLASGATFLVGVWWLAEGDLPSLSLVALAGFLGAGYLVGHLTACIGHLWEKGWWKVRRGKPYARMLQRGDEGFTEQLSDAIVQDIRKDFGVADLSVKHQHNLARAKLRMLGLDQRAESMRAVHGLCRNMAASTMLLFLATLGALVARGCESRLWVALVVAAAITPLFVWRTIRFERHFGREIWLGYLALRAEPPVVSGG